MWEGIGTEERGIVGGVGGGERMGEGMTGGEGVIGWEGNRRGGCDRREGVTGGRV